MSWEVIPFPINANADSEPKGDISAHFEDAPEIEISEAVFEPKNMIQRSFMTPDELHKYINDYRAHIANKIDKAA